MQVALGPSVNKATTHYLYTFLLSLNTVFFKQCFEFSVFHVGAIADRPLPDGDIVYSACDMIRKAEC